MAKKTTDESSLQFLVPRMGEDDPERPMSTTDKAVVGSLTVILLVSLVFFILKAWA